jgi:hypothetical protein
MRLYQISKTHYHQLFFKLIIKKEREQLRQTRNLKMMQK